MERQWARNLGLLFFHPNKVSSTEALPGRQNMLLTLCRTGGTTETPVAGCLWPRVLLKAGPAPMLDQVSYGFTQLSLEILQGERSHGLYGVCSSAALSSRRRNTGEHVSLLPPGEKWG